MNNEGVIVLSSVIVVALVTYGFKYAIKRTISPSQKPSEKQNISFEYKKLFIYTSPPIPGENIAGKEVENATPIDAVENALFASGHQSDRNSIGAMLYTMQRIVNSPNWFKTVKQKAQTLDGIFSNKVNVQLFKDAQYVLKNEGFDLKENEFVKITFNTAERYLSAINGMQLFNFRLNIVNANF